MPFTSRILACFQKGSNLVKSSTGRVLSIEGQRNQNGNTPGNEYIKAIGDQNTSSCAMANSTAGKAINWVVIFNRHVNVSTVALYTGQSLPTLLP